jgi:DNA polymerase elongation subunit (family B)
MKLIKTLKRVYMEKEISRDVLFFDMEMIPAPETKRDMLEKIFRDQGKTESEVKDAFEFTCLDGAWGRIFCIAYAFGDEPEQVLYREDEDERQLLVDFWDLVLQSHIVSGHKIMDSDFPFLYQRCVVHNVKPSRIFDLEKDERIFDTAQKWGWGKQYASLEKLSLSLGIDNPKELMHGSQVPKFHRQGRVQEILDYCKADVRAVREIYRKMRILFEQ